MFTDIYKDGRAVEGSRDGERCAFGLYSLSRCELARRARVGKYVKLGYVLSIKEQLFV
jgi:hypothetical protein